MNFYNQQQKMIQDIQKMQQHNQLQYQIQMQNQNPQLFQQQQQLQQLQQQQLRQQQLQLRLQQQQQQQIRLQQSQNPQYLQQLKQQQLQQLNQQQLQQLKQQQQQYILQQQMLNSSKLNTLNQYPTVAAAAALQANSVAVAGVKTNPLQQTIAQPAQFQKVIQQPQAVNPAFVVNGQDWKTKNKLNLDKQRKSFIEHLILILRNSQPSNQVNAKLLEAATKLESQIFTKATSLEEYELIMTNQINNLETKSKAEAALKNNMQVKVQQPATLTTHHTTPQLPASMSINKVNNNNILLHNNNTAAALATTINNASPSMNTAKLATSTSLQTRTQVAKPVAVANTLPKTTTPNSIAQSIQLQQQTTIQNQTHTQAVPQTPTQPATNAPAKANNNLTPKQKEEMIKKIENAQMNATKLKKLLQYINPKGSGVKENLLQMIEYVQYQYNIRNEKFVIEKEYLEKIDKSIPAICENLLKQIRQKTSQAEAAAGNRNAAGSPINNAISTVQQQEKIQQQLQLAQKATQPGTQAQLVAQKAQAQAQLKKAQVNNQTTAVKVETVVPESVNKTPITQPKTLTETIKIDQKNLKASSSEVFSPEDIKSENDKASKTSNSSSTKKRNNRKSNTPSSSVSSINNLTSKKSESSSVTELSSKKIANTSKDLTKLEKDESFLGKVDRNINIFALEGKNYKTHVKSNTKTRNIVQNSFRFIIDPNHPANGINSCSEEISSLCFKSNDNEYKDKPLKLENVNESVNDHISLFEDIGNRKSHIMTNDSKNDKKLQRTNKLINDIEGEGIKRKFDDMTDAGDMMNNAIKRINVNDKYSNIIEEINFLKDKYKINVNIVDTSRIALLLNDKENKSGEIPWNDFINMINTINKEESEDINEEHNLSNMNNNDLSSDQNATHQKINDERVLLVISLNLSNYIDTNEVENEYNIPGDNQSNIVIYARIPKSTQRYCLQGIFDWSLLYTKKKSIFQTSDEDNKLKEKKIYKFISQKIHDQEGNNNENNNGIEDTPMDTNEKNSRVIKVYHIVEWILEGIKN